MQKIKYAWKNADGKRAQRGHVNFFIPQMAWKNANDYMWMHNKILL